jgi:hypothetical protein
MRPSSCFDEPPAKLSGAAAYHRAATFLQKGSGITILRSLGLFLIIFTESACAADLTTPRITKTAYSGTGDLMAKCMQHASESYCEREVWGGGER